MDTSAVLRVEDRDRVRLLTLDRPEARNAFNQALYTATGQALSEALADDGVHAVVLTGAGDRAFSAGQDLNELAALAERASAGGLGADGDSSGFSSLLDVVERFDKPLLAAVNGAALGIGCTVLLHCDVVIAADTARFRTPFAPMGVAPEAASSYLAPLRLGWQAASRLLLAGDWLDADEALAASLVAEVVAPDDLVAHTCARAAAIASAPLASLRAIKRTMLAGHADAVAAARRREEREFAVLLGQPGPSA